MSDRARAGDMPAFERLAALICNRSGWSIAGEHAKWVRQVLHAALAAARAEEREACAAIAAGTVEADLSMPCPEGRIGCLVNHTVPWQRRRTPDEIAEAIRARGDALTTGGESWQTVASAAIPQLLRIARAAEALQYQTDPETGTCAWCGGGFVEAGELGHRRLDRQEHHADCTWLALRAALEGR